MSICQRILITAGEPAGIGPELVVQLAQHDWSHQLIIMADQYLLAETAAQQGIEVTIKQVDYNKPATPSTQGTLWVDHLPLNQPVETGKLNVANAEYVVKTLVSASQRCLSQQVQALVTAPVHKGIINDAGIPFSGHTELLAEQANVDKVVMMLATTGLRVALATTHLPLKDVANAITQSSLNQVCQILHHELQHTFGIQQPKILVAGLNPHAGENGHLGDEEIHTITPVLQQLQQQGQHFIGPLPADTLFTEKYLADADAVLAMYHDQGLPVLKYKGFGRAVNITLGLPFIRTSVDHGTALDIAGKGMADTGSLLTAIEYATTMIQTKYRNL